MITLKYMNNVKRQTVGEINIPQDLSQEEIVTYLLALYQNAGYEGAIESQKLYVVSADKGLIPLSSVDNIEKDATVIYSAVIAINNAVEFDRVNGTVYYIGSDEKKHFYEPHMHARIGDPNDKGGEKIRINLKTFAVKGKFKSRKKQREAIQYAKDNIDRIREVWNKVMVPQGGKKWEP